MEVSGKKTNHPSEPCEICQTNPVDGFCRECKEYMCKECFDHHSKGKPCRHHALCSLDQGPIQLDTKLFDNKCDIHRNENVKYYCRKHDVVGCGDCMVSNHEGCKPNLISSFATNLNESDEFKEMLRKIRKFDYQSDENMKHVQNNLKENNRMFDKALVEIRKFRKDINDCLDQAEKSVIAEANMYLRENESLLFELQAKIAAVSKEVGDIRNKLETNMRQDSDLFIRMVELKPSVSKVEQTVAEIKLSNTFKGYVFKPEQKLRDLLTPNVKFGCVELIKSKYSKQDKHNIDPTFAAFDVGTRVRHARIMVNSPPYCMTIPVPEKDRTGVQHESVHQGWTGKVITVQPGGVVFVKKDLRNEWVTHSVVDFIPL